MGGGFFDGCGRNRFGCGFGGFFGGFDGGCGRGFDCDRDDRCGRRFRRCDRDFDC